MSDDIVVSMTDNAAQDARSVPAHNPWRPIATVPLDGRPVLVWCKGDGRRERMHVGTFRPNVKLIGGQFSWDMPEALNWRPLPESPEFYARTENAPAEQVIGVDTKENSDV